MDRALRGKRRLLTRPIPWWRRSWRLHATEMEGRAPCRGHPLRRCGTRARRADELVRQARRHRLPKRSNRDSQPVRRLRDLRGAERARRHKRPRRAHHGLRRFGREGGRVEGAAMNVPVFPIRQDDTDVDQLKQRNRRPRASRLRLRRARRSPPPWRLLRFGCLRTHRARLDADGGLRARQV
jgi:hypothetical protein